MQTNVTPETKWRGQFVAALRAGAGLLTRIRQDNKLALPLPSKMYALDVKYSPMGRVTIRMVKNSSVLRAETRELSFLRKSRK